MPGLLYVGFLSTPILVPFVTLFVDRTDCTKTSQVCDTQYAKCVDCLSSDADCWKFPTKQYCNYRTCVECTQDSHCPLNKNCHRTLNTCVDCLSDVNCRSNTNCDASCYVSSGTCNKGSMCQYC